MKRRIDVEADAVAPPSLSARSNRPHGREESPYSPSVFNFNTITRNEFSPSATSSHSSITRDEVWPQKGSPFQFSSGTLNTKMKHKTVSDGDIGRVREIELVSLMESGTPADLNEREKSMFGGFNMDSSSRSQIDGRQYSIPFLSHVGCNDLGNRRSFFLFTLILALLLFVATVTKSCHMARVSTAVMRKQLIMLLDEAHVRSFTEGINFDTGAPCSLLYTISKESNEAEQWEEEGLDEDELQLLGTIMARVCGGNVKDGMMSEVLRGAHVVVFGDHGWFHDYFSATKGARNRTSSHYSHARSLEVPEGRLLRTLLSGQDMFGNSFENANWYPLRHPFNSIVHMVNYIKYKVTGLQIGPLGVSKRSDRFPIRKKFDGCIARS